MTSFCHIRTWSLWAALVATPVLSADLRLPPPMSPAESLAAIRVQPGLKVELVAAEPLVMDPIDIAWGPDGKLWVVEMADYPLGMDGKGKPGGRVRYLEDTDGDGRYDRSTVFLDGIPFPTGVLPWRKGVLVTAAPSLFYAEDTDGDGKADVQKPLFTGFGEGNQQHRFNSPRWGLDNWVYLANGDSDGQVRSTQTGQVADIRGRDLRVRPDDGRLDPQTGRAQFGRNRDDWDNWFGCNNSNPLWHYALADHYLRRNPHLVPPKATVAMPEVPGAAPVFPVSVTLARFNDYDRANRFTSACGAMIYRDNLLGPDIAGNAFICEPVHNLVHREIVTAKGVTFTSRRADDEKQSEFLASADNWFRPTAVHTGPDGALYIVDMYRLVIEHPQWIPPEWQRQLDLRAGHDKGRIYRVVPADSKRRPVPRLDKLGTADLVAALDSPNGWQRDMAQQLLIWRADPGAGEPLRKMMHDCQRPLARLHALCTLDGLSMLKPDDLSQALADDHPGVGRHAIRLAEPFLVSPDVSLDLRRQLDNEDPHVQMQLAYTLGAWKPGLAGRSLWWLADCHRDDPYLLAAVFSSINEANIGDVLILLAPGCQPPDGLVRLAAALGNADIVGDLLRRVCTGEKKSFSWQSVALAEVLDALRARPDVRDKVLAAAGEQISRLITQAREMAGQDNAPQPDRLAAIQLLGRSVTDTEATLETLAGLCAPQNPLPIQEAALAALAQLPQEAAAQRLLTNWNGFGPRLRSQVLEALLARDAWARLLVEAVEKGTIPVGHLDAASRQRLLAHRDAGIKEKATRLLAGFSNPDRRKVVEAYAGVEKQPSDAARGREVFRLRCAACHRLEGAGQDVGPDLTALNDKSARTLLAAILDPNQAVENRYLDYVAILDDGRLLSGILAAESSTSVTLKAPEGKEYVLLRNRLEELRSTGKSLMPEGLEKDISVEQMADLVAYLASIRPARKVFAGNEPAVIKPSADGSLALAPATAEVFGRTLVYEAKSGSLESWNTANDHAAWTVAVPRDGVYAVSLTYSCPGKVAGNEWVFEAGEEKLTGKVAGTASWEEFRSRDVGRLPLRAGLQRVVVRSDPGMRGPLFQLKAVLLTPLP